MRSDGGGDPAVNPASRTHKQGQTNPPGVKTSHPHHLLTIISSTPSRGQIVDVCGPSGLPHPSPLPSIVLSPAPPGRQELMLAFSMNGSEDSTCLRDWTQRQAAPAPPGLSGAAAQTPPATPNGESLQEFQFHLRNEGFAESLQT